MECSNCESKNVKLKFQGLPYYFCNENCAKLFPIGEGILTKTIRTSSVPFTRDMFWTLVGSKRQPIKSIIKDLSDINFVGINEIQEWANAVKQIVSYIMQNNKETRGYISGYYTGISQQTFVDTLFRDAKSSIIRVAMIELSQDTEKYVSFQMDDNVFESFMEDLVLDGNIKMLKLVMSNTTIDISRGPNLLLAFSCEYGNIEFVKLLLADKRKRIDPSKQTWTGNTPIYFASKQGHSDILELLLSRYKFSNNELHRCFISAAYRGHSNVVNVLLKYISIETLIDDGQVLWEIAADGSYGVLKRILQEPFKISADLAKKITKNALQNNHYNIVNLLLDNDNTDKSEMLGPILTFPNYEIFIKYGEIMQNHDFDLEKNRPYFKEVLVNMDTVKVYLRVFKSFGRKQTIQSLFTNMTFTFYENLLILLNISTTNIYEIKSLIKDFFIGLHKSDDKYEVEKSILLEIYKTNPYFFQELIEIYNNELKDYNINEYLLIFIHDEPRPLFVIKSIIQIKSFDIISDEWLELLIQYIKFNDFEVVQYLLETSKIQELLTVDNLNRLIDESINSALKDLLTNLLRAKQMERQSEGQPKSKITKLKYLI
jgi:ankyrin repeat protein